MSDSLDIRIGDLIRTDCSSASSGDIVIIGVPTDEGIRRNGGRVGAAQAPDQIRKYLKKLTPFSGTEQQPDISTVKIYDHGNITGKTLEEIHLTATATALDYSSRGCFVISIGGGHDITYPIVKGLHQSQHQQLGLINIDAHLDVRPKRNNLHHSGSSFRLLLEEEIIDPTRFVEFGIQPFSAAKEHCDWTTDQGASVLFYDTIRSKNVETTLNESLEQIGKCYLSFDIDSIRSADAPGCSAPSPIGFSADEALEICLIAAKSGQLMGFDIVEVNPLFDVDSRTSRLGARMIATCIFGLQ